VLATDRTEEDLYDLYIHILALVPRRNGGISMINKVSSDLRGLVRSAERLQYVYHR